jgi:superfamily I DNA/RNA helicase/RecB family exonuclease
VTEYLLRRPEPPAAAPVLDASQQAVVDHGLAKDAGPLLVLAGPGTGKTTTVVELVADRVRRGIAAEDALVLTFSRKAAQDLRARIARRLPDGAVVPTMTFHAYCYALVRAASDPAQFADPLRLLSAPEQELRIAEVLLGATDMGRITWPAELGPALRTRGFTREIADFLGRARSFGLDPEALHLLADERQQPSWHPLADLWREYDEVLSLAREADYSGLVDDALSLESVPEPRLLVVDEYQDTDPAQVALLRRLAGPATELVAVGDPDQSIYAFRGADVGGIWKFPEHFGTPGRPAATRALRQTRRFGPELLAASRAIVQRLGISGSLSAEEFTAFRNPVPGDVGGRIDVRTYTDARAEAEHIARTLRRAHLAEGVPYGEMAVLVRAGRESIAPYERALRAAGLPVEVAGDEIPLASQPAIRSILMAARAAIGLAAGRELVPEEAEALLTGPLGNLDPAGLRSVARALRQAEAQETGVLRDSREVVAEALAQPTAFALVDLRGRAQYAAERAARLGDVLRKAAQQVTAGAPAEQVLWTLWDGTAWPRRLAKAADAGDDAAHRDLDALVALFDDAARAEERGAHTGLRAYLDALEAQQIPADSLADHGTRGQAVRVMTAHRAKGLEWDLVVVAGVQDGRWPVIRPAATLLQAERLDPRSPEPPGLGALLAEERRLFYVALTRARRRLIVTAVESLASDGEQPSRLFDEMRPFGGQGSEAPLRRPRRPVSLRGAVTQLRHLAERGASPTVRAEAARRLADLIPLVPAAEPGRWWGMAELTQADAPVRLADEPLELSGSAIESLTQCGMRWFLTREAKGEQATSTAQGFGLAVHVLAAEVVEQTNVDADELLAHLDAVWHRLDYETPWIAGREREEATAAVRRFVRWHLDRGDRTPVGAEVEFVVEVPVGDDVVRLRGSMDRIEVDSAGHVHIVDFKTGRGKPSKEELAEHAQLGVYQLAVGHGAVPAGIVSGGAELVQLRQEFASAPGFPVVQTQDAPNPDEPFFAYELLRASVDTVRGERFHATMNSYCAMCAFRRMCPAFVEATLGDDG